MEKRFKIEKVDSHLVDGMVRSSLTGLFNLGCQWKYRDGSRCLNDIECRCMETRSYAGKPTQVETTWFFCLPQGIDWAKRTGAVGADKIFTTLALQP